MSRSDTRATPPDGPLRVALVMAGGQGQRFWPLSTGDRPKQFLDLERHGRSLLQATVDRVAPLVGGLSTVLVATNQKYVPLVREQLPDLPPDNVLVEPTGRDSAPAIALAALHVRERLGNALMAVYSSDHRIADDRAFQEVMADAYRLAHGSQGLVTVGILPTRPATGFGYIEKGDPAPPGFHVAQFVEKPNRERASAYLAGGRHLWNAGIFAWSTDAILAELDAHAPEVMRPLRKAFQRGTTARDFGGLPKLSIDYAVMERTQRAYVVPGDFGWDDIGDWAALERLLPREDGAANTVIGTHVGHDASGNIVYTHDAEDVIVTLGVRDLVIVKKDDTVLIVRKDRVQEIKTLLADDRLVALLQDEREDPGDTGT